MSQHDTPETRQAWRVICTSDSSGVRAVSRRRVRMTVPPSDEFDPRETSGFWVEVRDADERVQYRRTLADPDDGVEVPGTPERGSPTRHELDEPRRFAFLVPEASGSDHVSVIRARATSPASATARSTEVVRVPLGDLDPEGDHRDDR